MSQTHGKDPKVEWEDFLQYHEEAMAFIEHTEQAMQEVCDLLQGKESVKQGEANNKEITFNRTTIMRKKKNRGGMTTIANKLGQNFKRLATSVG